MSLGSKLKISFEGAEMVWALRKRPLVFRRGAVLSAVAGRPEQSWKELRLPGTSLPGVIKAGTYLTPRGCEFWYVTRPHFDCALTIRVDHPRYRGVILGVVEPEAWAQRITDWIQAKGEFAPHNSWLPWAPGSSGA
jgi:hypothetical protein